MKKILIFTLFLFFSISVAAQTGSCAGNYEFKLESINAKLIQSLILNPDGTFMFHSYEYHEAGIPKEKNKYARGRWEQKKKIISFSTNKSDFDEKYTIDFNRTKARFDTKSSRDKSNRDIKTSIRFYDCEIFWVKGKTLFKVSN